LPFLPPLHHPPSEEGVFYLVAVGLDDIALAHEFFEDAEGGAGGKGTVGKGVVANRFAQFLQYTTVGLVEVEPKTFEVEVVESDKPFSAVVCSPSDKLCTYFIKSKASTIF